MVHQVRTVVRYRTDTQDSGVKGSWYAEFKYRIRRLASLLLTNRTPSRSIVDQSDAGTSPVLTNQTPRKSIVDQSDP
jgi:hypothetical protein